MSELKEHSLLNEQTVWINLLLLSIWLKDVEVTQFVDVNKLIHKPNENYEFLVSSNQSYD